MKPKATVSFGGLLLAILAAIFWQGSDDAAGAAPNAPAPATVPAPAAPAPRPTSAVGFTSRAAWQSHFGKHGAEFGAIDADRYLALAQQLRDAPLTADVLESVRDSDGVVTRFDRRSGAFVAFHRDQTIRTFFKPNDGEAYFRRQTAR
ncbi:MAG: hypothetical protein JNL08_08430 [Planctomycetes bacterium]|nr:hypothetical protein [Planctomycetota bacterium]